jgi:hypothetical protein
MPFHLANFIIIKEKLQGSFYLRSKLEKLWSDLVWIRYAMDSS